MNFRHPFQISRVSAICQSSSAVNLISKFTPIYGNHVKNQNKDKQNSVHHPRTITKKCMYMASHLPFNICQQRAFIHDIRDTEEAVKRWVRYEQNCDCNCDCQEPELAFRQTSKINCCQCTDCKPCRAPPLGRPLKLYDDSKCLYEHKCNPDMCNINPLRMDNVCCLKIVKKKLPCLPASNCCPCMDQKPMTGPRLCPPTKLYDPDKIKLEHKVCVEPKCVRMDDLCACKVVQKRLPVIPLNNCKQCLPVKVLTAPKLKRPLLRYDPLCLPYPHPTCPCDIAPCRRDSCCESIFRNLPPMPCSNCVPCQPYVPTTCPCLKRLTAKCNSLEMEHEHECPESPCDTQAFRRDIFSVTATRKKLPQLCEDQTCYPCTDYRPLTAPELRPPVPCNCCIEEEQTREHCVEEKCIRRDGVIRICRRCLPPVPTSICNLCLDKFTSCTTPNFVPLKKLYDDTKCKYRHICIPEPCDNPSRMDDICCIYTPKTLPKPPDSPDCKPCIQHPKSAPRLRRLCKRYDDTKQKFKHPYCPQDPCKINLRADNITGMKDEVKILQAYKPLLCKPCLPYVPCKAPKLCRPRARYNDSCMLYDHKYCPTLCDETVFRRDQCLWEGPKQLPEIQCGTICCDQCQIYFPSCAPPLTRPRKLYEFPYDPIRYTECTDVCPPRRDDLLCWKPKRKKLPSFRDCDQCCCYSTLSRRNTNNVKRPLSSISHLHKKVKTNSKPIFSTNHISTITTLPEKQNLYKSKKVLKENCHDQKKQVDQSTTKTNHVKSKSRYYVVKEPTWKCINVSEVQAIPETNTQKKYDYSTEKWLREGVQQIVKTTSKSSSYKTNQEYLYCQLDNNSKYSTVSESLTPVKFTGYDTSECNKFLCVKKNDKLQPLRIGSAFKSEESFQSSNNISCNKSAISVSRDTNININKNKITTALVSKESKKPHNFATIIQEYIEHKKPARNMPVKHFILNLNNKMQLAIFQKIFNFFKHCENIERHRKILVTPKNGTDIKFERNKFNKEFMDNVCEKYMKLDLNKIKMRKNKAYIVKKIEMNKSAMYCCSRFASDKEETNSTKQLPKKIKMKIDQIRNFSTNIKRGQLCYKHIDISDDYIGKIYKVKLKKIGIKNLMLEKNDPDKMDEEPHTICYICKVVPRYQPIYDDEPPDFEDVKINDYKEKRNTIE